MSLSIQLSTLFGEKPLPQDGYHVTLHVFNVVYTPPFLSQKKVRRTARGCHKSCTAFLLPRVRPQDHRLSDTTLHWITRPHD